MYLAGWPGQKHARCKQLVHGARGTKRRDEIARGLSFPSGTTQGSSSFARLAVDQITNQCCGVRAKRGSILSAARGPAKGPRGSRPSLLMGKHCPQSRMQSTKTSRQTWERILTLRLENTAREMKTRFEKEFLVRKTLYHHNQEHRLCGETGWPRTWPQHPPPG